MNGPLSGVVSYGICSTSEPLIRKILHQMSKHTVLSFRRCFIRYILHRNKSRLPCFISDPASGGKDHEKTIRLDPFRIKQRLQKGNSTVHTFQRFRQRSARSGKRIKHRDTLCPCGKTRKRAGTISQYENGIQSNSS